MELANQDVADRISELPEPLLHHILSFLVMKDTIKTSFLFKTFYNAWTTLPYLDFGENFLPTQGEEKEKFTKLLNLVGPMIATRLERKISIQKFWIQLRGQIIDVNPYINRFITSVVKGNIKELVFLVKIRIGKWHTMPEAIYAAKKLHKLHLEGFKLDLPPAGVKLLLLRKLCLSNTYLDNNLIQLLTLVCPNLEELNLEGCQGFDSFQIFGSLKLKRIILNNYDSFHNFKIQIEAPSLEFLYYCCGGGLTVAYLNTCYSLKKITLHKLIAPCNWVDILFSHLPFLEHFCLIECEGLKAIRISSNRLKTLDLWHCVNLVHLELDAPNLFSFIYGGVTLISLSLKASAIRRLQVGPSWGVSWCQNELIEFLEKFNHFKTVTLYSQDSKDVIVENDTRENFRSPLYGVKSLGYRGSIDKTTFLDFLDSLLWIAPSLDTLSLDSYHSKKSLQFIYEDSPDIEIDDNSCCSSLPIACWRHNLKKVKCVNLNDVVDEENLKNYLLKNVKILEIDFVA